MRALGADTGISKSEGSRICADLDAEVSAFRDRSLAEQAFLYVFIDATCCKDRVNRRVVSQAVVFATGVPPTGTARCSASPSAIPRTAPLWTEFLRTLKARGLTGLQLVISDAHSGLKSAIATVLLGSSWQALTGALHAQRARPGVPRQQRDGRRRHPHGLRPA
ncbi:transposase [Modestobacter sp. SYSU DS0657]